MVLNDLLMCNNRLDLRSFAPEEEESAHGARRNEHHEGEIADRLGLGCWTGDCARLIMRLRNETSKINVNHLLVPLLIFKLERWASLSVVVEFNV